MDSDQLRSLFEQVRSGDVDIDGAMTRMRHMPFEDLGFVKIDHHRGLRPGMQDVLPSVVGGLVACPVIAVPTSVGYGASFHGLAALLGMLNSCASNVTVVNIDNGFGAGYVASLINRL